MSSVIPTELWVSTALKTSSQTDGVKGPFLPSVSDLMEDVSDILNSVGWLVFGFGNSVIGLETASKFCLHVCYVNTTMFYSNEEL